MLSHGDLARECFARYDRADLFSTRKDVNERIAWEDDGQSDSFDTEAMPKLIGNPNINKTENKNVGRNLELDIQKEEHDDEDDEEPCRPVSWSRVHFKRVCERDCRGHVYSVPGSLSTADMPIDEAAAARDCRTSGKRSFSKPFP